MTVSDVLHLRNHPGIAGDDLSLKATDRIFGALEADIESVVNELGSILRTKSTPRYCFDFDTLFPVQEWGVSEVDPKQDDSFWTSLALDLPGFEAIILPGTLFELLTYLQNRINDTNSGGRTAIENAFLKSFSAFDFDEQLIDHQYINVIRGLKNMRIGEPDLYLMSLLKDKFINIQGGLPQLDFDVFLEAIHFLSKGRRINRVINNRVDAYNYSLVSALNENNGNDRFRYALISRSDAIYELDKEISKRLSNVSHKLLLFTDDEVLADKRYVCSPRRAAIMQLLWLAGNGAEKATRIAWELLSSIRNYRSDLAAALAGSAIKQKISEILSKSGSDIFLSLISSFESIQRTFSDARKKHLREVDLMRQKVNLDEPTVFLQLVKDSVQSILESAGYGFSLNSIMPKTTVSMSIIKKEKDTRFKYLRRYDITPRADSSVGVACSYFSYTDYHLFAVPGIGIVEEFVACMNVLRQSVSSKMAAGTIPFEIDGKSILTVGIPNKFFEADCDKIGSRLSTIGISRFFEIPARDINFVRIDAKAISASFEGKVSVISSPYALVDEFAFFVREMTRIPYRAANFRDAIDRVVKENTIG